MNNEINNNNNIPTGNTNPQDKFVVQQPQIVNSNTVQMPQTTNQPVVNPQPIGQDSPMVNENLKKVEINNYTPPSKFKIVLLILFFIILIAFVLFLPEITALVKKYQAGKVEYDKEVITTGKLVCSMETSTSNLDKDYDFTFSFSDSKLTKTKFITVRRGDSTLDEGELDSLAATCENLKKETKEIEGITISCDYQDTKLVESQTIDLETIDEEKLNAAFTEAGGILPGYQYNQDIDEIEKNMKVSGYTCKREK